MKANILSMCVLISLFAGCLEAASIKRRSVTVEEAHAWLRQYGFMTATNPSDEDYTEAMTSMQQYYGLQDSGSLDQITEDMMLTPRCGIKDIGPDIVEAECTEQDGPSCRRRRFTTLGQVWDSTSLTYRFNNYSPDLSRPLIQSAIQRALVIWGEVAPLSFTKLPDGNNLQDRSDIEISFGFGSHGSFHPADQAFDGPSSSGGSVLAHAFNPGSKRFPDLRGDMHFDEDEFWQDGAGIDLFTVAAHEFGHSLGLGHSNVRGALMFPTYFGFDPNFQLHENDIQGIQSLYGALETAPDPTTPKVMSTTKSTTTVQRMSTPEVILDYCNDPFDSIATINGVFEVTQTVLFKMTSRTVARFATDNVMTPEVFNNDVDLSSDIQMRFQSIWNGSPITAVVQKADGSLVVIRESNYWEYDTSQSPIVLKPSFPQPLSNLGIPSDANIVAALSDRDQGSIYLFSENAFWTFTDNLVISTRSPESISDKWPGIPGDFDSVFIYQGDSYFVKGTQYWLFNETTSEVESGYPRSFGEDWLGCESYDSYFVKGTQYWLFNETTSEVESGYPRSFGEDWLGCESCGSTLTFSVILFIICCILDSLFAK